MRMFFKTRFFYVLAALFFAFPFPMRAAGIFFGTETQAVGVGAEIPLGVYVNTENEDINAVEGFIDYPADLLKPILLMDGDSIVAPWVERPSVKTGQGRVRFSGIIPGGYAGPRGTMFFIVFETLAEGQAVITSSEDQLLRNDGLGTPATTRKFPITLDIRADGASPTFLLPMDQTPPEEFLPVIAQDPHVFDGQWFISFLTQDKDSGIDHYEVREGNGPYVVASSPYLLQNQSVDKNITVKAVDRQGNERLSTLQREKARAWYQTYPGFAIMLLTVSLIGWILSRRFFKRAAGA